MDEKQPQQQPEQTQVTAQEYLVNKTIDNLATANANQALEIANLKAQLQLIRQQQEQQQQQPTPQPTPPNKKSEELEGDLIPKDEKKIEH